MPLTYRRAAAVVPTDDFAVDPGGMGRFARFDHHIAHSLVVVSGKFRRDDDKRMFVIFDIFLLQIFQVIAVGRFVANGSEAVQAILFGDFHIPEEAVFLSVALSQ